MTPEAKKAMAQEKAKALVAIIHSGWPAKEAREVVDLAYDAAENAIGKVQELDGNNKDNDPRVVLTAQVLAMQLVVDRLRQGIIAAQHGASMMGLRNEMVQFDKLPDAN